MILIPLAVLWAGYTGVWYGWSLLQGEGMGLADLVFPNRGGKADNAIKAWGKGGSSAASKPPYIPGPGVQPGSPNFPANPNGGLPSKPPVGGTPPAYYG